MNIIEIRYEQVSTLKPFETLRVEARAVVNEGEDQVQAFQKLRDFVVWHLEEFTKQYWDEKKGIVASPTSVPKKESELSPSMLVKGSNGSQQVATQGDVSSLLPKNDTFHSERQQNDGMQPFFPDDLT